MFSVLRGITNNEIFAGVERKQRDVASPPQIKLALEICKGSQELKTRGTFEEKELNEVRYRWMWHGASARPCVTLGRPGPLPGLRVRCVFSCMLYADAMLSKRWSASYKVLLRTLQESPCASSGRPGLLLFTKLLIPQSPPHGSTPMGPPCPRPSWRSHSPAHPKFCTVHRDILTTPPVQSGGL